MSEIDNLLALRNRGIKAFVESEQKRWVSGKGILCVHDRRRYPVEI